MKISTPITAKHFFTLQKFYPNSCVYNIPLLYKFNGTLPASKLLNVFRGLSVALPILNARVESYETQQLYFMKNDNKNSIHNHKMSEDEVSSFVQKIINTRIEQKDPLFQVHFITVDSETSYLLILQHHMITDLGSKEILIHHIEEAYNNNSYPEIDTSHENHEAQLDSSDAASFWTENLCYETLHLPSSEFGRKTFSGQGRSLTWKCERNSFERINSFEKDRKLSSFIVFLTVYAVLLHRLSNQSDFNIGVPFTNRQKKHQKDKLGAFVNILPLHVHIDSDDTFQKVYTHIRKQMLLLHRVQAYPFLEIAKLYRGERNTHYPHILQAGFTQEPLVPLNLDGLEVTPISVHPDGAQMDLFFTYWPDENGFSGRWEYNSDAFSDDQVSGWIEVYNNLLQSAVQDFSQPISIPLRSSRITDAIHSNLHHKEDKYPIRNHIAKLLLESYTRHSEETAIVSDDESITYEELSKTVTSKAAFLYSNFGIGNHIAVIMQKSPELIMTLHAVVISGNIFVPIDPSWPDERKQFIIDDAEVACILTEENSRAVDTHVPAYNIPELSIKTGSFSLPQLEPDAPMYLMYTSGSTGKPKGALLPSNGIINRLFWMQDTFPITQKDTLIQKTPFTFDVSMWEIFWPFLFGAGLFVPDAKRWIDNGYILQCINKYHISYIHFVPSMLRLFLAHNKIIRCPELKGVICSGEAIDKELFKVFLNKWTSAPLYNLYGPTEASIDVTYHICSTDDLEKTSIPIGHPVSNTGIWILDEHGNMCLPYVEGDLYISGIQLAKCYWNRDDLSAEAFTTISINDESIRIYRTGDRARYWHDGSIEYLGRKDSQVKINGVRIELAEIENELDRIEIVKKSVVLYRSIDDSDGSKHLVAFLEGSFSDAEIHGVKEHLSRVIPGYMIPDIIVAINTFPLLSSGKIDKKQLSAVPVSFQSVRQQSDSSTASMISSIWSRLLHVESVDHDKNFFDLGGHSMLILRMQDEIREIFNIEISLPVLFQYTTVSLLAAHIDAVNSSTAKKNDNSSPKKQNFGRLTPRNRKK